MYKKSLFKTIIFLVGGIIFSSLNVSSVSAISNCYSASFPGRIIVDFNETGIRSDRPASENRHHVDRSVSLPAGTYNIVMVGSDDRNPPISVQPKESFKLILKNGSTTIATTSATPDLSDSIDNPKVYSDLSLTNFSIPNAIDTVIAYHDAFPDTTNPNSVHPVCAGFDPITPTVSISASPNPVVYNGSSTLTWSSSNATSCTASGAWSGTKATSGSQSTGNLTSNKTYTLTCTGAGISSAPASTTVTVGTPPPIVSLSATPTSIPYDSSSTLTWSSSNATSCTASGDWSGTKATSGSQSTGNLTSNKTYTLTCIGPGGSDSDPTNVTVGAQPPIVSFSATPSSIPYNSSSTLTWSSTGATSCTASGAWSGTKATSGSESTGNLTSNKTYTLTCTGAGGNTVNSTTVTVAGAEMSGTLIPTPSSWYNLNWPYRVKVTVNSAKVSGNLNDFPVYVNLNNLPAGFHSHVNQTDARDIRVTKADGITELPREIVSYDSTNDTGELHFLADTLSSTSNTDFYIYYGNTAASNYTATSTYGRNAVWASYKAVWHLQEAVNNTAAGYKDATANANNGTGVSMSMIAPNAKLGKGQEFIPSSDYIEVNNPASLQLTGALTLSAWMNADTISNRRIVDKMGSALGHRGWGLNLEDGDTFTFQISTNSTTVRPIDAATKVPSNYLGQWVHLVGVYNPSSYLRIYVNGVLDGEDVASIPASQYNSDVNVNIGRMSEPYTDTYWDGKLDEIKISTVVRSPQWIAAEYNNQSAPSAFYNIGSEETPPIEPPSCIIASGDSTCSINLSWSITNPEGDTTAITAIGMPDAFLDASLGSGSKSLPVTYPSRIFYLYNNAKSLVPTSESPDGSGVTITSSCVSGTSWNGSICALFPPTVTFSANPTTVVPGDSSLLSWSSTNTVSCTASGDWSGTKTTSGTESTGSLTLDKTYTLTCTGGGGQASDQVTVKVNLTKDIKKFEEN